MRIFRILSLGILLFIANSVWAKDKKSEEYVKPAFNSFHKQSFTYKTDLAFNKKMATLEMDVYRADGDSNMNRPCIIWFHGGSFMTGSKSGRDVVPFCEYFTQRGFVNISVDYRLGMEIFPPNAKSAAEAIYRATQDGRSALDFISQHAKEWGINPNQLIVAGSSAGGFIAMSLAFLDKQSEIPTVINTGLRSDANPTGLGPMWENNKPENAFKPLACINMCGALIDSSWIENKDKGFPLLSIHGNKDKTVPAGADTIRVMNRSLTRIYGSIPIHEIATKKGLNSELIIFKGADHVPYIKKPEYLDTTMCLTHKFIVEKVLQLDNWPKGNNCFGLSKESKKKVKQFGLKFNKETNNSRVFAEDGKPCTEIAVYGKDHKLITKHFNVSEVKLDDQILEQGIGKVVAKRGREKTVLEF